MKKIILTGGGTAGHVMGNFALLPGLRERGFEVVYVGSYDGIERDLAKEEGLTYRAISSGMLRRFASFENVTDMFRVVKGIGDALRVLRQERPDVIFSKGGYVTVPVAVAAALLHIPFIAHESDLSPGLANRLAARFAKKMLVTFPETAAAFGAKGQAVGSPLRQELLEGDRVRGLEHLGFSGDKPVLLAMGGSLGSKVINEAIWSNLSELLCEYDLIHLTGKGHLRQDLLGRPGYRQMEYAGEEMKDLLAACDLVVSRAGSNSIFEFLVLKKPHLLIPLGLNQSRGDQILNARSFQKAGYSMVLQEEEVTQQAFLAHLRSLREERGEYIERMGQAELAHTLPVILDLLEAAVKENKRPKLRSPQQKPPCLNFQKTHAEDPKHRS
ncbi:UDP-N-acetylglucosamine--N-acetylmuramyl- (pentapeptide) pyrophosphoryl-undecaprenol N-acetylglucosamine transferase [Clostridiaceae bacterium JG1575]|nr:UDP-N-acetylglucosamine--N-acetylmuramyl- (pentapeptide) pyrophosphoryl-undecaprenol N-acetylglucosamine transferase [Clostridiaceae bacterium JG1575]